MKWIIIATGIFLAGFLFLVLFLYLNQRKMLYFPRGLDRNASHISVHRKYAYEFEHQGVTLRGWLLNSKGHKLLIYYGGNGEELSYLLPTYKIFEGYAVLLMNFRGYGESEGSPTEKHLVDDAVAILDRLKERYDSIVLMGRSLGSGVAVQVASRRKVDRLVLVTPYDSITAVAQEIYPWAPVSLLLKDKFDSLEHANELTIPALFLVAELDEVISPDHARKLAEAWNGPVFWELIHGATHNTISDHPKYWEALTDFLKGDDGSF